MSKISTEDCKHKLKELFPDIDEKSWKRTKKYKNESGSWVRDFTNTLNQSVSLIEENGALTIYENNTTQTSSPIEVIMVKKPVLNEVDVTIADGLFKKYYSYYSYYYGDDEREDDMCDPEEFMYTDLDTIEHRQLLPFLFQFSFELVYDNYTSFKEHKLGFFDSFEKYLQKQGDDAVSAIYLTFDFKPSYLTSSPP